MSAEEPFILNIGSKRYRSYEINIRENIDIVIDKRKVELLDFDDGEASLDENFLGLEAKNAEEILEESNKEPIEEEIHTQTLRTDNIYFDASDSSYSLFHNMGNKNSFKKLSGMRPTGKTQLHRKIEQLTRTILKPNQADLSVEIKGHGPESVIRAQMLLFEEFNTPSEIRPDSYDVINQTSRQKLQTLDPNSLPPPEESKEPREAKKPAYSKKPEDKIELEEYPELKFRYDNRQQGFVTYVQNFPQQCISLLLADGAKLLKQLKNDMNKQVDFFINKQRKSLEILGYTKLDVVNGYAAFIRLLRTHPQAAKSFWDSLNGKQKERYTHFLAVSFMNNSDITAVQQEILDEEIGNYLPDMRIPESQFHITLGLFTLEKTDGLVQALQDFKPNIQSIINQPLDISFSKANCFGGSKNARTLVLEPEKDENYDKLNQLTYELTKYLYDKGFITDETLKDKRISLNSANFTYEHHLTLAKISRSKSNKNGAKLDLSSALPKFRDLSINARTHSLELLAMKKDSYDGPYNLVHKIDFTS